MMGSRAATLLNIGATSIHGQINVALQFRLDDDDGVSMSSVPAESCPSDLKPGERVQLDFVLGNVMKVSRL